MSVSSHSSPSEDESSESKAESPKPKESAEAPAIEAADGDAKEKEEEKGGDEDEEGSGEEIEVEKIHAHYFFDDGTLKYEVEWKGWPAKKDRTWEPYENLEEGAIESVEEYHKKIGGPPKQGKPASTKRARSSTGDKDTPRSGTKNKKSRLSKADTASSTPPTSSSTGRAAKGGKGSKSGDWEPPKGSWEKEISSVDTIEQDDRGFHVYLQWNNGRKTRHPIEVTYEKCPQKMLHFYEQHLVFREGGGKLPNGNGA
ncbi:MAG: hypothetical protein M1817_003136 [Caeruleum heppii]|nr:MAG: hypothetical protein M1817_003136 [Caeruleum heppii]